MLKSTFNGDVLTIDYGQIAVNKFAEAMAALSNERAIASLADYANIAQACLTCLCKDLEEHLDIEDCLSIIHNVYMYVASHDKKYREKNGDIIDGIARKEKEPNE